MKPTMSLIFWGILGTALLALRSVAWGYETGLWSTVHATSADPDFPKLLESFGPFRQLPADPVSLTRVEQIVVLIRKADILFSTWAPISKGSPSLRSSAQTRSTSPISKPRRAWSSQTWRTLYPPARSAPGSGCLKSKTEVSDEETLQSSAFRVRILSIAYLSQTSTPPIF